MVWVSDFIRCFLQNTLQNLAGQHTDVLENLSPIVRKRVEVLRDIQACPILKISTYCCCVCRFLYQLECDILPFLQFGELGVCMSILFVAYVH